MRILAIDTSYPEGSAALATGEGVCSSVRLGASSHLVSLAKAVSSLLDRAGLAATDIDRVAVVLGPGSFTGLRVGMAFVKGLYAATAPEVVVMSSLELLARQALADDLPVSPMIDARRNEVYAAYYRRLASSEDANVPGGAPQRSSRALRATPTRENLSAGLLEVVAPCVTPPDRYLASLPRDPAVFLGSGAVRYRADIEKALGSSAHISAEHEPDTQLLCRLAEDLVPVRPEDVVTLEPTYIRPSDVELKPLRDVRAYDRP